MTTTRLEPTCSTWHREQQLFTSWRTGDAEAGRELLCRLQGHLARFFRARNADLADDLVQETLLACVRARMTLTDEAALRGYVYTTARRILARERDRHFHGHVEIDESLLTIGESLCVEYDRRRAIVRLRLHLQARRTLCTHAAELYYLEGRRGPEIAGLLGIAEGTVRSRIRHGLRQLMRGLEPPATP